MALGRRHLLFLLPWTPLLLAAGTAVRGKLTKASDGSPILQTPGGREIRLTGDEETAKVLQDERLAGSDFEAIGVLSGDKLAIAPIYEAALFVHRDGKRLRVTYWCDVCAIRTYSPGICWCCREETELDLREPDKVDK